MLLQPAMCRENENSEQSRQMKNTDSELSNITVQKRKAGPGHSVDLTDLPISIDMRSLDTPHITCMRDISQDIWPEHAAAERRRTQTRKREERLCRASGRVHDGRKREKEPDFTKYKKRRWMVLRVFRGSAFYSRSNDRSVEILNITI